MIKKRVNFYRRLYKRFGARAILFLINSKFRKDKLNGIAIKGISSTLCLSNFATDVTTLFQVFYAGEYDIILKNDPEFIIDCGAHIGLSAVYFATKYPTAKIIAIEPDPGNFYYLKKNTRKFPNVICLNKAVWSYNTMLEIKDIGTGNWSLQTIETTKISASNTKTITIDQVMAEYNQQRIDLLKIDIEGAEIEIFKTNYDLWLSKTRVIAIELHEGINDKIPGIFFNALKAFSYEKYYKGENLICEFD